jgi:hypothetical protein
VFAAVAAKLLETCCNAANEPEAGPGPYQPAESLVDFHADQEILQQHGGTVSAKEHVEIKDRLRKQLAGNLD